MRKLTDQELVSQYLQGNQKCLNALIERHQKRVYAYIMMLVKDPHLADDVFQDTFVKVVNKMKIGSYKEEGKFLQWTMRIAHNLTIDHYRKSNKMPKAYSDDNYDVMNNLKVFDKSREEIMITEQIHNDVKYLVEQLPQEQKEVLKMRHYADMSFKDIAEQTGVSINTALGRMRYALINLRRMAEEKDMVLSYNA